MTPSTPTTTTSSASAPQVQTGATVPVATQATQAARTLVVAVHGVGDQYSYATLQSVVNQFCQQYDQPMTAPLGAFHNGRPIFFVEDADPHTELPSIAFAEVYWATIPRGLVAEKHTLEEAKKWATTIVERLRYRSRAARDRGECHDSDFAVSTQILHEMIETIAVADRLCFLAEKAGLFTFDLRRILDDYLGDVQVVAEFATARTEILKKFHETMEAAHAACPNADIHIVAHSEGTVVAMLGLLQAFRMPTPPAWTGNVRGFMTLGSPIDKHLYFWPRLFGITGPASTPASRIAWRNYYDFGDPIGFELDTAREWLAGTGWNEVFAFDAAHDYGFTRYPFPGKAHVDYWNDRGVFGHFINTVIAKRDGEALERRATDQASSADPARSNPVAANPVTKERRHRNPPELASSTWSWIVSWVFPYVGVFALLVIGAFIVDKSVLTAIGDNAASAGEIFWGTMGLALLLAGVTVAARVPRLTRSPLYRLIGLAFCALTVVACVWLWGTLEAEDARIVQMSWEQLAALCAGVIAVTSIIGAFRPQWGATPMILLGTMAVAASSIAIVMRHDNATVWPLFLATAAFLYLWWLAALLFDLIVVWHLYIRSSLINRTLRRMTGDSQEASAYFAGAASGAAGAAGAAA